MFVHIFIHTPKKYIHILHVNINMHQYASKFKLKEISEACDEKTLEDE